MSYTAARDRLPESVQLSGVVCQVISRPYGCVFAFLVHGLGLKPHTRHMYTPVGPDFTSFNFAWCMVVVVVVV